MINIIFWNTARGRESHDITAEAMEKMYKNIFALSVWEPHLIVLCEGIKGTGKSIRTRGMDNYTVGIFQQRYVKRHGIVAADTVPSHEKREALDLNIVRGTHHAGAGQEPSGSMAGPDSEERLELGSIAASAVPR